MKRTKSSKRMDHVAAIQKYIETMTHAEDLHILIIEGPPGWGKTTAVQDALRLANIKEVHLGAYSTPLNLFNFLAENSDSVVLIDDCAGIFHDSSALAILKAATWPSINDRRVLKWGSTSSRASTPEFEFTGKLIVVCNSFPVTPDGRAIRSRGYLRKIQISLDEAKVLLKQAALNSRWFQNQKLAVQVAIFLSERVSEATLSEISFRTLKQGYRLAERHPESWKELFSEILPTGAVVPEKLIKELSKQGLKVKDQAHIFQQATGLKIRSFYHYRKDARLSRTSR
jgi:hypothetical protein